jgi:hypothetical protein
MGELAKLLERIDVEVTSPDGQMTARVQGRVQLSLEFRGRAYGRYEDTDLARQLGQLATLAWIRYHRNYMEVEEAFLNHSVQEQDPEDLQFEREAEQLTVTGSSPGGWVTTTSRALISWTVRLEPGTQRELSQDQFVSEALAAAGETVGAYRAARARLLDQYYDLSAGLPPWRRSGAKGDR